MARQTFFSFHHQHDAWRAGQVRNSWVTKDRNAAGFWDKAEWEEVKKAGDLERLRNFVRIFGTGFEAGNEARLMLADRLIATNNEEDLRDALGSSVRLNRITGDGANPKGRRRHDFGRPRFTVPAARSAK